MGISTYVRVSGVWRETVPKSLRSALAPSCKIQAADQRQFDMGHWNVASPVPFRAFVAGHV
jgi:hypothetical protein